MSGLFDNAIDSLKVGIRFYLYEKIDTAHKHAILNIFHSIELFLKEKLYRVNPLFIYKNIDKPITDDSLTIGLEEIFARFRNMGIILKEESILRNLRRRRNRIEHHRFEADESHFFIIGKSLKFLYYFLPEHLECSLEDIIDEKMYRNAREIILKYEERLAEAEKEVAERTTPRTKDDLCEPTESAICPECGNHTVVTGTERGNFCFFCLKEVELVKCDWCGEYFSPQEMTDYDMCYDYFQDRIRRW
jgi:hypothetical protein